MILLFLGCAFVPLEGNYLLDYNNVSLSEGCSQWILDDQPRTVVDETYVTSVTETDLVLSEDTSSFDLYSGLFRCTLDRSDFSCGFHSEDKIEGYKATFTWDAEGSGAWTSPDAFSSSWTEIYHCEGEDCGNLPDCSFHYGLSGNRDG